jgi:hypothetical protein
MDLLCARPELSPSELTSCNRCRLSIEAITMADITSGSGNRLLDDSIWLRDTTDRPSKWIWPRESPCPKDTTAWRKGLSLISSPSYQLHDRLGVWIEEPHK